MRVVLGSDERTPLTDAVRADLEARGADIVLVGPPAGEDQEWAEVGRRVGEAVAGGATDTGVLFCWTGTGASIAANKVAGVRAALCTDAETAAGARKWNDANVLVMSLRLTSPQLARRDARCVVRSRSRSVRSREHRAPRGVSAPSETGTIVLVRSCVSDVRDSGSRTGSRRPIRNAGFRTRGPRRRPSTCVPGAASSTS